MLLMVLGITQRVLGLSNLAARMNLKIALNLALIVFSLLCFTFVLKGLARVENMEVEELQKEFSKQV